MPRAERIVVVGGAAAWEAVGAYRAAGGRGNVLVVSGADGEGGDLVLDTALAVDVRERWVEISEGVRLDYDRLLLIDRPDLADESVDAAQAAAAGARLAQRA